MTPKGRLDTWTLILSLAKLLTVSLGPIYTPALGSPFKDKVLSPAEVQPERQVDFSVLEASLVYGTSSRTGSKVIQRNSVSGKKKKHENNTKEKKRC